MNQQSDDNVRICFMNSNMVWGGGEKRHYETACHFRDLGYAVMVITNKKSELHQKLEDQNGMVLESVRISNFSFLNPFKILHIINLLKMHDFLAELIENNEPGYLIPFTDTQLFADKIVYLKNNKLEFDTFVANARKQVERKFDFSKNMRQIIDLIKEQQ